MPPEATLEASIAGIISNLARTYPYNGKGTTSTGHFDISAEENHIISLSGEDNASKSLLERELNGLAARIRHLEAMAAVNSSAQPTTLSESGMEVPDSTGTKGIQDLKGTRERAGSKAGRNLHNVSDSKLTEQNWVHEWLACGQAMSNGVLNTNGTPAPTQEQLHFLREHTNQQSSQIEQQREHIDGLRKHVEQQQHDTALAFDSGIVDITALKRELGKHQQANLAFQKALREIGSIVTAVANGDLSKKVLIDNREMDPEIATFKRTINKMVDQLQDFASQVTFLAKEVGTEGRLGGQADLPGVAGRFLFFPWATSLRCVALSVSVSSLFLRATLLYFVAFSVYLFSLLYFS